MLEISDQEDGLYVTLNPEYNSDEDVEIVYYWYHHMIDNDIREAIQRTINEHDFNSFMLYYDGLNDDDICFLPPTASIYSNDKYVGEIALQDSDVFSMITYSECECG